MAVVAAALLFGGLILLVLLQTTLVASTEAAARRKAQDVIAQIAGQDVTGLQSIGDNDDFLIVATGVCR